jgi:hypothetical protein
VGKDIEIGKADALKWDPSDVPGSLQKLRDYVEQQADTAGAWYLRHKGTKSWFSRYMRLGVILATSLGALLPIAGEIWSDRLGWARSGLVPALLVGIAAALLGADRAFGFSTGWIRYITTAAMIRKALEEFRLDWALKMSQAATPPTNDQVADLVRSAKAFRLAVEGSVLDETRAWAVEFQNALAQLEKEANEKFAQLTDQARQEAKEARDKAEQQRVQAAQQQQTSAEAARPGSIELSVPNSNQADDRTVKVQMEGDGVSVVDMMVGSQRWSRIGLRPGTYRLIVSAQSAKQPITDQAVCVIKPGEVLRAELKLPIGGSPPPEPPAGAAS